MTAATLYLPCDAAALSVGADDVAAALLDAAARTGAMTRLVRNG